MADSALSSYLKSIFFKKISKITVFRIVLATTFLLFFALASIYSVEQVTVILGVFGRRLIALIALLSFLALVVSFFVEGFLSNYEFYKKWEYGKVKIPTKIDNSDPQFDLKNAVIGLNARIETIEKNLTPFRLAIYAIFIGIAVAVALAIGTIILQKLITK